MCVEGSVDWPIHGPHSGDIELSLETLNMALQRQWSSRRREIEETLYVFLCRRRYPSSNIGQTNELSNVDVQQQPLCYSNECSYLLWNSQETSNVCRICKGSCNANKTESGLANLGKPNSGNRCLIDCARRLVAEQLQILQHY